jgi:N4-gp56 family major capsid protein
MEAQIVVTRADGSIPDIPSYYGRASDNKFYFKGEGASAAAAETDCISNILGWLNGTTEGGGLELGTSADAAGVTAAITTGGTSAYDLGFRFSNADGTTLADATTLDTKANIAGGNLYGSSKDIGTISGKLPALSETGGRVNRVGFKRRTIEGSLAKFGFFDEYTQESLDFDSDAELETHINREMLRAANEITEDKIQIDLINGAGVVRYPGAATSLATLTGAGTATVVSYDDLLRLSIDLDNNRCPKQTTVITGSRMTDTKVIRAGRVMYIGSELQMTMEKMTDGSDKVFIPVAHYAAAGTPLNGEIGAVGHFRVVVAMEMLHKAGVGASEGTNLGYRVTEGKYDAYPMLVVGEEAFTTVGFQSSGKNVKFTVYHKKPGKEVADRNDPFGETGFMSIKWYYGTMILRPERLAVIWTVAKF